MPFGLPNAVAAHQRLLRSILEAHEVVLAKMEMVLEEPPAPSEPLKVLGPGAHEDWFPDHASSATSAFLHLQRYQVTSFKFHFS